jgi:hypothetical protein
VISRACLRACSTLHDTMYVPTLAAVGISICVVILFVTLWHSGYFRTKNMYQHVSSELNHTTPLIKHLADLGDDASWGLGGQPPRRLVLENSTVEHKPNRSANQSFGTGYGSMSTTLNPHLNRSGCDSMPRTSHVPAAARQSMQPLLRSVKKQPVYPLSKIPTPCPAHQPTPFSPTPNVLPPRSHPHAASVQRPHPVQDSTQMYEYMMQPNLHTSSMTSSAATSVKHVSFNEPLKEMTSGGLRYSRGGVGAVPSFPTMAPGSNRPRQNQLKEDGLHRL